MKKEINKDETHNSQTDENPLPTDQHGNIVEGTNKTPVGEVRVNKLEPAKHYDTISFARAMNKDFAKKTKELFYTEIIAVKEAISTGIYVSYRPIGGEFEKQDCLRVASTGRCFCSHLLKEHNQFSATSRNTACNRSECSCKRFVFAPGRPEDFGEFWLPKRRDFNREAYRMKCKCKHTHEEHICDPSPFRCKVKQCGCLAFSSASVCAACDQRWEGHDTVFETEEERKNAGRQISRTIVKHFTSKISAYVTNGGIASLTEMQVFEIIQENYESLDLRVYDCLPRYYEQTVAEMEESNDRLLVEIVRGLRETCLDASVAYQSRFAELAVIH